MKSPTWAVALFLALLLPLGAAAAGTRAIFLFKDVMKSNTMALTTSGFNTLIIFGVGVLENGDIMYYSNTPGSNDTLIASGGAYVGGAALEKKVRSLKGAGSSVDRIEICMNSNNLQSLMSSPGPGSNTNIYRNFAALKAAWNLDAVNNDDESIYDVASTATFVKMVGRIGYKYGITPYVNVNFWNSLRKQVNAGLAAGNLLLDRCYLQCYDGGYGNDPLQWQSQLSMKVVPILWVVNDAKPYYGMTPAQAQSSFSAWAQRGALGGGGYWNDYDIEKMGSSYPDYAKVLNNTFP